MILVRSLFLLLSFVCFCGTAGGQTLIGYYSGDARSIDRYPVNKLTHIIFGFCHLKKGRLYPDSRADSLTIKKLVSLKAKYPALKVLLSLGGWGGCKTCSEVFSTEEGRTVFAAEVAGLTRAFHTDGIDIDWEFPALPAYPGHPYSPADKENLTALLAALKKRLGPDKEVCLTAAGFSPYLEGSVDWRSVAVAADRIQLMTYDMIGSRNKYTGHHTPLYSTSWQQESTDRSVRYLDSLKVPLKKVVIGVAFYAREFVVNDTAKELAAAKEPAAAVMSAAAAHGLHQPGRFRRFVPMKELRKKLGSANGYTAYWDDTAQAPYSYNYSRKSYLSYDDERSIAAKAHYVREKGLNGIMFWELRLDIAQNGLLDALYKGLRQ
jgi:chitinase